MGILCTGYTEDTTSTNSPFTALRVNTQSTWHRAESLLKQLDLDNHKLRSYQSNWLGSCALVVHRIPLILQTHLSLLWQLHTFIMALHTKLYTSEGFSWLRRYSQMPSSRLVLKSNIRFVKSWKLILDIMFGSNNKEGGYHSTRTLLLPFYAAGRIRRITLGLWYPYLSAWVTLARELPYLPCKRYARGSLPIQDNFPPSWESSNLNEVIQFLS